MSPVVAKDAHARTAPATASISPSLAASEEAGAGADVSRTGPRAPRRGEWPSSTVSARSRRCERICHGSARHNKALVVEKKDSDEAEGHLSREFDRHR